MNPRFYRLFFFLLAPLVARGEDWPQWMGPNRDGLTAETGLLQEWPEGGPEKVWSFEKCGLGYSGPAIVGDTLYVMGERDKFEQLIAIDVTTGEERWATNLGDNEVQENEKYNEGWLGGPRGTPTVVGDRVYCLASRGELVCLNSKSGDVVWTKKMQDLGGKTPAWGYAESPLVADGMVVCTPGGGEGAITAFDAATGEIRWRCTELNDTAHYSSILSVTAHGKPMLVQLLEKRVVGLSPADGKLLWESPFDGSVAVIPTPLFHDNSVYITSGYGAGCQLITLDADLKPTAEYKGSATKLMSNHHGGVVRIGEQVYGHSDGKGWLCQNFATGKREWLERGGHEKGSIAYADGRLYCLGEGAGEIYLIAASPEGWEEQGHFKLEPQTQMDRKGGKIWTHPVISGGKLFLRDQDQLHCYDVSL